MRSLATLLLAGFLVSCTGLPRASGPSGDGPGQAGTEAAVAVRVDEFKSDAGVRIIEVERRTITGTLKRELERRLDADPGFDVEINAVFALSGNIRELTIDDVRLNANGDALERIARIRVDVLGVDETSGREVFRAKNVLVEHEYYTDTYSLELGLNNREALEEKLLPLLIEKIHSALRAEYGSLPRAPAKKITLSEEERELLEAAEEREKRKLLSFNLEFNNETIHIPEGSLAAGGQSKPTTNRFTQTSTLKIEPQKVGRDGEMKGIAIGKYEPHEDRELTLQRGELEYQLNPNNLLKLGTVSGTLDRYVFDQTVAGFTYDGKAKTGPLAHNLFVVGGREFRPNGLGDISRFDIGGAWKVRFKEQELAAIANLARDRDLTFNSTGARIEADNRIFGLTGKFVTPWQTTISGVSHRSYHKDDRGLASLDVKGRLHEVKLSQQVRKLALTGEYYFADDRFRTLFGSATTDKKRLAFTAALPAEFKYVKMNATGDLTRSSKVTVGDPVEVLGNGGISFTVTPFPESKWEIMKNLAFLNDESIRRTYDEIPNAGIRQSKNLRNFKYLFGGQTAWKDILKTKATYEEDREENILARSLFTTEEFKWENTLTRRVFERYDLSAKANYRTKDAGGVKDRFVTAGATIGYQADPWSLQFDYLKDVKRGTVKSQDTTKDRFTLDLSTTNENGAFKNTISLRGDYEINHFDNPTQNHDRFTGIINLKVAF